ncbi:hypothetical protein [Altererythrobacter sp. MF3-039]|uniref:hypothetical protein n=1 Tax=Altererythrobacter sp. MF3-039 TaxID=3252901 RepID=UPI00390CBC43
MSLGIIVLIILGVVAVILIKAKSSNSSSVVVTGPGVRKIHDVECKFRTGSTYHGDLDQSRWSDGQERLEMNLRRLPGAYSGPVRMFYRGQHLADLDAKGGRIDFAWKGRSDEGNPKFEIGEEIRLEFGGQSLTGIVEAD